MTVTPGALAAELGHTYSDPQWRVTSTPPVPPARFGTDPWSTFAYVETRIVDYTGLLDHDHMRCNTARHPAMQAVKSTGRMFGGLDGKYPTMLKTVGKDADGKWGVEDLADHDDYDCLDDLAAAGLLEIHMPRRADGYDVYVNHHGRAVTRKMIGGEEVPRPSFTTGLDELTLAAAAVFTLTDLGQAVAGELRAWKGEGCNFHQFTTGQLERA
jgi:hypothetical protein